jgi:hypothetical protein
LQNSRKLGAYTINRPDSWESATSTLFCLWCHMLLMLEDNTERVNRFKEVVGALDPNLQLMIWRNAKVIIREMGNTRVLKT